MQVGNVYDLFVSCLHHKLKDDYNRISIEVGTVHGVLHADARCAFTHASRQNE